MNLQEQISRIQSMMGLNEVTNPYKVNWEEPTREYFVQELDELLGNEMRFSKGEFFHPNNYDLMYSLFPYTFYLNKYSNKNFKFIHVGTDEIYGDLDFNSKKKFHENSSILPNNPYSASKAASDADEPPPDPPGIRERSQGLWVGPYAEFSVEEPIANSSRFVLPTMMAPASRKRDTTVASYGGFQPSRILEEHVVSTPWVHRLSFMAIGTPASGPIGRPAAMSASIASA